MSNFKVDKKLLPELYREGDSIEFENETYSFIMSELTDGDGEWHRVIVQRESDKRYFEFSWGYDNGNYYYENEFCEVFKKIKTIEVYE